MSSRVLLPYREASRVQPYRDALVATGLDPVLADVSGSVSLNDCRGLLLMGGSDVDPDLYGEKPHPETDPPDRERDEAELRLLAEAQSKDIPVLAICRGLQLMNVACGGTLVQHLEAFQRHCQPDGDRTRAVHQIRIEDGSLLRSIAETSVWNVNSRHHQAVKTLGEGLHVSAADVEDGVVEALERRDGKFMIAVQWHPEDQTGRDPEQLKLFAAFAKAVA